MTANIGAAIKRLRNVAGVKASQMASDLGISNAYLSELENNKKTMTLPLLEGYARRFGISASTIVRFAERLSENREESPNYVRAGRIVEWMLNDWESENG